MAREPWKPSESELRDHYRSISQSTRESRAIQGEVPWDAYIRPYRRPGYYVRRGVTPPQWMGGGRSGRSHGDRDVCPGCGEDYERRWHGSDGTVGYDHGSYGETGPICRMEAA